MILKDIIFLYILTIKELLVSLSFIARQCKCEHVNKIYQVSNFLKWGCGRQKGTISRELKIQISRELKTSKFSLVLRTLENSDVFNTLDEIYLVFTSKK